jgi:hypothetical protein
MDLSKSEKVLIRCCGTEKYQTKAVSVCRTPNAATRVRNQSSSKLWAHVLRLTVCFITGWHWDQVVKI